MRDRVAQEKAEARKKNPFASATETETEIEFEDGPEPLSQVNEGKF